MPRTQWRALWKRFVAALKVALRRWIGGRTSLFAAALAFHSLLALAPLLLLLVSVAGPLLGKEAAHRSLTEAVVRFAGPDAARIVSTIAEEMSAWGWDKGGTFLSAALMLF